MLTDTAAEENCHETEQNNGGHGSLWASPSVKMKVDMLCFAFK